jgi:NAD(P)-dependent dehydrogenase (short-subunit alcohol dehydrogenase family)
MADLPQTPSFRVDGRRALVTGAGRGIGLAASTALAEHGAAVTLVSRTAKEIDAVAAAIRARGQKAEALVLDVTDVEGVRKLVAERGPFDILVNNAGWTRPAPMVDVTIEDYDKVMGTNLRAAYFVAQAVVRGLVAAKRPGSIIHLSSQLGHVGMSGRTVYSATKHALEGLTKSMAVELAPHGIRVNALAPTYIATPLTRPLFEGNKAFPRRGIEQDRARPPRRGAGPDGRDRLPRLRCLGAGHRHLAGGRRRLDGGIERSALAIGSNAQGG